MKTIWSAAILLLLCAGLTVAQEHPGFSPYPGGSPFPPGKEPSLTHIVDVYWTTMSGMETLINVHAEGYRPTQLDCVKVDVKKQETINSTIAPDCAYRILLTSQKEKTDSWYAKGQGNLTVRVYGFNREDFDSPPVVSVQYFKDGQLIGTTQVLAKPVPSGFKIEQPNNGQQKNVPVTK